MDLKLHWDKVYEKNETNKLGWYEENPEPSIELLNNCQLTKEAAILNVGAGASTFIDALLSQNYSNLIVNDISANAIQILKERLKKSSNSIRWITEDLMQPQKLRNIEKVQLWHDRAVLHFFTMESDQIKYFDLLKNTVRSKGWVIIAAFNKEGAEKCSGLPVFRYNTSLLQEKLGMDFELIKSFDYIYTMPSGDTRPYIYTLFKRN